MPKNETPATLYAEYLDAYAAAVALIAREVWAALEMGLSPDTVDVARLSVA